MDDCRSNIQKSNSDHELWAETFRAHNRCMAYSQRVLRRVAILAAVLLATFQAGGVNAARDDIGPISGTFAILTTMLTGLDGFVVDNEHRRVFALSEADGTVLAMDFDGNQTASRTGFDRPSAIAIGAGSVFVLLAGTGQIVRLDPNSLAPVALASGLVNPIGLAFSGNFLYTFAIAGAAGSVLQKVDANTGAVVGILAPSGAFSPRLHAFAQLPGVLFWTRSNLVPSGLFRYDVSTATETYSHEMTETFAVLPDGDVAAASYVSDKPAGVLARRATDFELTGRRWLIDGTAPSVWTSTQLAIVLGLNTTAIIGSTTNTGQTYRRYEFVDGATIAPGGLLLSADSSKLFVASHYNGTIRLYSLPGVGKGDSASQAPGPASSTARGAAPQATGSSSSQRSAAPQARNGPWVMASISDIEFGSAGVYASDKRNGVVNVFANDGPVLYGWRQLDGVEELAELNGSMFGLLTNEGSVVAFDPGRQVLARVARNIASPSGLTAANGKLWTTHYRQLYAAHVASIDPVTGVVWRQPYEYSSGFDWSAVTMAERPIAGHLLGSSIYGKTRFDLSTLAFADYSPLRFVGPFAVAPDGGTVIDSSGNRATTSPFALDGVVFPGSMHTISGATLGGLRLVAATSSDGGLVVYDESDPFKVVYSEPATTGFQIQRIEFRPGTTELWVGAVSTTTGQAYVVRFDVPVLPRSFPAQVGVEAIVSEASVFPDKNLLAKAVGKELGGRFIDPSSMAPSGLGVPQTTPPNSNVPTVTTLESLTSPTASLTLAPSISDMPLTVPTTIDASFFSGSAVPVSSPTTTTASAPAATRAPRKWWVRSKVKSIRTSKRSPQNANRHPKR
jgi:hypothetical protein